MLTIWGNRRRFAEGVHRREFLRVGALGMCGLTLPALLRQESHGAVGGRPKSVIYVVLGGGPSHIDSYDLKPHAPAANTGRRRAALCCTAAGCPWDR